VAEDIDTVMRQVFDRALETGILYGWLVAVLPELRSKLAAAARDNLELVLTPDECRVLAHHVADPVRPKGRPPDEWGSIRTMLMARHCYELELAGQQVKAAVSTTAEKFGCKASTVWAARKEIHKYTPNKSRI
jgi:hypothetical protein